MNCYVLLTLVFAVLLKVTGLFVSCWVWLFVCFVCLVFVVLVWILG